MSKPFEACTDCNEGEYCEPCLAKDQEYYRALYFKAPKVEVCEEHEFDSEEGYTCLNCGLDGSEEMMAMAFDRAKDMRKYGP